MKSATASLMARTSCLVIGLISDASESEGNPACPGLLGKRHHVVVSRNRFSRSNSKFVAVRRWDDSYREPEDSTNCSVMSASSSTAEAIFFRASTIRRSKGSQEGSLLREGSNRSPTLLSSFRTLPIPALVLALFTLLTFPLGDGIGDLLDTTLAGLQYPRQSSKPNHCPRTLPPQ